MKKIFKFLFSSPLTIVLLIIYAIAIGLATFIEDKYDTVTSKIVIFNALWFEILHILLVVNMVGVIITYKMWMLKKMGGFIFHSAFILLIIGAGITRYFGYEGNMHIREGVASNIMTSSETYFQIVATDKTDTFRYSKPLMLSQLSDNTFDVKFQSKEKGKVVVEFKELIKNAVEKVFENTPEGKKIVVLHIALPGGSGTVFLEDGKTRDLGAISLAFNNDKIKNAIHIKDENGTLKLVSPTNIIRTDMMGKIDSLAKDTTVVQLNEGYLYKTDQLILTLMKLYEKASIKLVTGEQGESGADALVLNLNVNEKNKEIFVFGGVGYVAQFSGFAHEGVDFKISYGERELQLPFQIFLNDFKLERYPGSMSPSSFESEVNLVDKSENLEEKHRIFMNNVLDYKGFRFFQSSYDTDEKGTILSVNHDFWGTWTTYIGYILLAIGFIVTMFSKNSRFITLMREIREISDARKKATMMLIILLSISSLGYSQQSAVSLEHAQKFSKIVTQSFEGRFEPIHTLAFDLMHKISRLDKFDVAGKGKMDASQMVLDMVIDANFWKAQKLIYVRDQSVRDLLGLQDKYAKYNDFFDEKGQYRLAEYAEIAFRKKQSEQNKFDQEIIKVDERVNVFMGIVEGTFFRIFPAQNDLNHKWLSWGDTLAFSPLTGAVKIINDDLQIKDFNYSNILRSYFLSLIEATKTGNYDQSDKILGYIANIQKQGSAASIIPSDSKISFEIFYNNANFFPNLKNYYGIISILLLVLGFIDNFKSKPGRKLKLYYNIFAGLLFVGFLLHTFAMGLRWYLSGHAPWSNGYEALLLVAWGGLFAGFLFLKYSKITLGATAVLAFSMLMTAGHSSYDPQLTNLQPVLKSYWLIIHVAIITVSYGFLGLGFLLGIINMFLYILKNKSNETRMYSINAELTGINEITMIAGVFLATMGTFLGGVWANESWGRYWGWDAKETWALVIVIVYTIILHFRFVPALKSQFAFNAASVFGFATVLMTFIGVNYYLSKGLHSYAAGDTPVFPIWAWVMIFSVLSLISFAAFKYGKDERIEK